MNPTHEQTEILQLIKTGKNIIVDAGAGCGKTTTINLIAKQAASEGKQILAVCFNRNIQQELEAKLGAGSARTFNSIALQCSNKHLSKALEYGLVATAFKQKKKSELWDLSRTLQTLFSNAPASPEEFVQVSRIDNTDGAISYKLYQDLKTLGLADRSTSFALSVVDFVELPKITFGRFDIILVDEAQDMNLGRTKMLQKLSRMHPKAQFVFVGDPRQSIYGFTGSLPSAMRHLKSLFNCLETPLQTCFRCPKEITDYVKVRYPQSALVPFKSGGEVRAVQPNQLHAALTPGSVVLARTNAQLVEVSMQLIKHQVPHYFNNMEMGKSLLTEVNSPKFDLTQCRQKLLAIDRDKAVDEKVDRKLVLSLLATQVNNKQELIAHIEKLFAKVEGAVILYTVHGAKGLEFDNVFVINARLGTRKKNSTEDDYQQEKNLLNVALTRAKKLLAVVTDVWTPRGQKAFDVSDDFDPADDNDHIIY